MRPACFILPLIVLVVGCDAKKPAREVGSIVEDSIDGIEHTLKNLGEVTIFVKYDASGDLWLSGPDLPRQQRFQSIDELSNALSEIASKGKASVLQDLGPINNGLMGDVPPADQDLEKEIRRVLAENGFSVSEHTLPAAEKGSAPNPLPRS